MPELPEVETSRRGIEPHLVGQRITRLVVRQPLLRWPVPQTLLTLTDKRIISVQRRAKYLLLELDQGGIIIHLGMSGSVRILPGSTAAQKHDHIDMLLTNDLMLRYTDPRRFGAWLWCEDIHHAHLLAHLGPEPLSEDFNQHYIYQCSRHKKTPIKSWLMDNKIVVGIGNIYANESLFTARIHPNTPVNTLTKAQAKSLSYAIKTVLLQAITKGGTTLKDFLQSDGKPGYFAQELHVYGRAGQPCRVCGSTIARHPQRQRATFFCPQCQRHTPSR